MNAYTTIGCVLIVYSISEAMQILKNNKIVEYRIQYMRSNSDEANNQTAVYGEIVTHMINVINHLAFFCLIILLWNPVRWYVISLLLITIINESLIFWKYGDSYVVRERTLMILSYVERIFGFLIGMRISYIIMLGS